MFLKMIGSLAMESRVDIIENKNGTTKSIHIHAAVTVYQKVQSHARQADLKIRLCPSSGDQACILSC